MAISSKEKNMKLKEKNYNSVAWFYQQLSQVYSGGQIKAAKLSQIPEINSGDKVLYPGVGSCEDAVEAAKKGAEVTCIDVAPKMLENGKKDFEKEGVKGEFICTDIMEHDRKEYYDAVAANFFLNVYGEEEMKSILTHLVSLIKPGGKLLIADFSLIEGNFFERTLQSINYRMATGFYWLFRIEAIHPVYDYTSYFPELGLTLKYINKFKLMKIGPYVYQSINAVKDR